MTIDAALSRVRQPLDAHSVVGLKLSASPARVQAAIIALVTDV
jgi:hypothetical protein